MKDISVEEGNKLIARFMELKLSNGRWYRWGIYEGQGYFTKLKYHSSFDWLIPVVETTNVICQIIGGELSNSSREQEHLHDPLGNPAHWKSWSYNYVHLSTDIKQLWNKTIQFIIWYNENQKANTP